ncbi:MAG: hypothetical protein ACP5D8_06390 [Fidelibacterota bacterium]
MLHLNISLTDFIVIGAYFVLVMAIGLYFSNHKTSVVCFQLIHARCGIFY